MEYDVKTGEQTYKFLHMIDWPLTTELLKLDNDSFSFYTCIKI